MEGIEEREETILTGKILGCLPPPLLLSLLYGVTGNSSLKVHVVQNEMGTF